MNSITGLYWILITGKCSAKSHKTDVVSSHLVTLRRSQRVPGSTVMFVIVFVYILRNHSEHYDQRDDKLQSISGYRWWELRRSLTILKRFNIVIILLRKIT